MPEEPAIGFGRTLARAARYLRETCSVSSQKRTLDASRLAEMEEDAYFNSDDGPSTPLSKAQAQVSAANNMLKRKRLRGNTLITSSRSSPRASPAPLVDYEEEEEDELPLGEAGAPDAGPSTSESRPSPSTADGSPSLGESALQARQLDVPVGFSPRPTAKRRRSDEDDDEDDGLARLAARKRQALSSDDEDELVAGAAKPAVGVQREEGGKKLKLVLALKSPASSFSDEKMKDDGG